MDNSIHPDTSYPIELRNNLRVHGLTPPNVESHTLQLTRCESSSSPVQPLSLYDTDRFSLGLKQLDSKTTPIEKYIYLSNLRNSNVHLFYRLVLTNFTVRSSLHRL